MCCGTGDAAYRGSAVPKEELDRPAPTRRAAVASRPTIPRGYAKNVHIVGAGETLWAIAQQYDVKVNQLKAWNGIQNHQNLRAGQRILIWKAPGAKTVVASRATPGLSSQLIPTAQAAPAESSGAGLRYTVRSGDTLWAIAQEHGVSVARILELNGLPQRAKIRPGDVLTIKP